MFKKMVERQGAAAFGDEEHEQEQYHQGEHQFAGKGEDAVAAVDKQYRAQQDGQLQGGHGAGKQAYDNHKPTKEVQPGDDVRQPGKGLRKMARRQ